MSNATWANCRIESFSRTSKRRRQLTQSHRGKPLLISWCPSRNNPRLRMPASDAGNRPCTCWRSLDEESVFLGFASLHFLPHPPGRRAAPSPGQLGILLAAILWGDLAALEL